MAATRENGQLQLTLTGTQGSRYAIETSIALPNWNSAGLTVTVTTARCECYGRVVMLSRDISGVVFPETLCKFFLDATEDVREQRHLKSTKSSGAKKRDIYDANRVIFTEDSLMIDTSTLEPAEVSGIILVEVFLRASNPASDTKRR